MRWLFEAAALAGLLLLAALPVFQWPYLPESVPTHFDGSGVPDAWGDKDALVVLPVVGLLMYAGLGIAGLFVRHGKFTATSPGGRERQLALTHELLSLTKAELLLLFAWLEWKSIQVAQQQAEGLGRAALPVILVVVGASMALYLVRILKVR